ncbi:MAG TPA: galactokinase [Polyangiaceae bacterium]|nr:galactokinase [Polyangiaceae bacterium]
MVELHALRQRFEHLYQQSPRIFSAPGRVNLIGEHTDYNDGFVLPIAIDRRTFVAAAPRPDSRVIARSLAMDQTVEFDLSLPGAMRCGSWLDYIEGTARALMERGFTLTGANLLIDSDVPRGAGLSASAALELSVGYALAVLGGSSKPDPLQLALAGQAAEHTYVGTLCGIMDQYISALAVPDHALLIDCRSLAYDAIAVQLNTAVVLICDTQVKHELSSSAYNERRRQCETGVREIARHCPGVRSLRDMSPDDLEAVAPRLPPLIARRCRHVVTENARTLAAVAALKEGNVSRFGSLMSASHASLRDDYEVSCPELDEAVAAVASEPGVFGSRMTGGGFGGCTVSVLEGDAVAGAVSAIRERLRARFGLDPEFFVTKAAHGIAEERVAAPAPTIAVGNRGHRPTAARS